MSPRWASVGWLALAFCVVVLFFGELLRLPDWVVDLSPFSHLALMPPSRSLGSAARLLAVAAALGVDGTDALDRRDVH